MAPRQGPGVLPFASEGGDEADRALLDVQYGREIALPAPNYHDPSGIWIDDWIGAPVDLVWAQWPEPRQATLTLRVPSAIVWHVYVTVTMTLGGSARFTRTFPLAPGAHLSLRVFGKSISVSAYASGNPVLFVPGVVQKVIGAITEGDLNPLGDLVPIWTGLLTPTSVTASGVGYPMTRVGFPTSGLLLGVSGFLDPAGGAQVAGTPYYLQAYDVTPDLALTWMTAIASLSPLVVLGPLVGGTNASFAFDRSLRPSVRFVGGLGWALSTQAGGYVATPAPVGVRIQGDYGI